jgi:hypothetical protein
MAVSGMPRKHISTAQERHMVESFTIAEAAQAVAAQGEPCSEGTLRRLDRLNIVKPRRDPWGRRIYSGGNVAAAHRYLAATRKHPSTATA